jgi:hypothetical protein
MSGADDDEPVGYGRPPKQHRFKKNQSGNPAGRKPKRERALIPRQLRQDILAVGEMKLPVRTAEGETEMPAVQAVLYSPLKSALAGRITSMRLFLTLNQRALDEHFEAHPEFAHLERIERASVINPPQTPEMRRFINSLRKATRRK